MRGYENVGNDAEGSLQKGQYGTVIQRQKKED